MFRVGTDVQMSWSNGTVYDSIEVRRDGSAIDSLPGTTTTYTDLAAPSSGSALAR